MNKSQPLHAQIELNVTLPTRESDWLNKQIEEFEIPFERLWCMSLDGFGQHCDLFSAIEKVTGKAKQTRFFMRGSLEQAERFLNHLRESNHPSGITWAICPIYDSGVL